MLPGLSSYKPWPMSRSLFLKPRLRQLRVRPKRVGFALATLCSVLLIQCGAANAQNPKSKSNDSVEVIYSKAAEDELDRYSSLSDSLISVPDSTETQPLRNWNAIVTVSKDIPMPLAQDWPSTTFYSVGA